MTHILGYPWKHYMLEKLSSIFFSKNLLFSSKTSFSGIYLRFSCYGVLKGVHLCYFQLSIDIKDKSHGKAVWELCTHWPSLLIGHVLGDGAPVPKQPLFSFQNEYWGLGAPSLLPMPFWMPGYPKCVCCHACSHNRVFHYFLVLPPHSPLPPFIYLLSPRFTGSWGSTCRSAPRPPSQFPLLPRLWLPLLC